ncbi:flagellar basal body rod protein FlgF [Vibrio owensii]|uniref:flagellar basal body rod protein FlgF n=1 Tax=Vibrio owensii TaxID=696485 RepID=UPI0018F154D2|nr:flagellar basal body rod protein FlgF [Vibrio owensii]
MSPILFNAAKAAERAMHAQHARANNLSNVETVGFKSLMEFTTPQRLQGSGFDTSVTTRTNLSLNNFSQGNMMPTGRALDVAIEGDGFIAVEGRGGTELYTRSGEMEVNQAGEVTIRGRRVLTDGGPLVLPDYQDVSISNDGLVSIIPPGGDGILEAGLLKIVNPGNEKVTLDESGLFRSIDGEQFESTDAASIKSGYLEGSNVSGFGELVGIMNLTRQFEVQVKVMSKADELARMGNELMRV